MGVCCGCEALGAWVKANEHMRGGNRGEWLMEQWGIWPWGAWLGAAPLRRGEGSGLLWPGWPAMTWCGVKWGRGQGCVVCGLAM